jgi:hypothetical protein
VESSKPPSENMILKQFFVEGQELKFSSIIQRWNLYSLFLIKCPQKDDVQLEIHGNIELVNPFGYLEGEYFGYYPVTFVDDLILGLWVVECTLFWIGFGLDFFYCEIPK